MGHRHYPVTSREPCDARADALDNPGDVIAEYARGGQPGPGAIGPVAGIHRVNPSRVHRHPDLPRPRNRVDDLGQPQLLRTAELTDNHRFQHSLLAHTGRIPAGLSKTPWSCSPTAGRSAAPWASRGEPSRSCLTE